VISRTSNQSGDELDGIRREERKEKLSAGGKGRVCNYRLGREMERRRVCSIRGERIKDTRLKR